jgi:hypothetical protein
MRHDQISAASEALQHFEEVCQLRAGRKARPVSWPCTLAVAQGIPGNEARPLGDQMAPLLPELVLVAASAVHKEDGQSGA